MNISECDLPGVGKRFEMDLGGGETAIIVIHNSGRRELFYRPEPNADSQKLLDITDQEARVLGTILEGAYFQPIQSEIERTTIGDGVHLEWYELEADGPLVGKTLAELDLRNDTGTTIVAVERGGDVIPSPGREFLFQAGDVIVAVGSREQQERLEALLGV